MAGFGIALCITDLDVGGAERSLVDLVTRLDRSQVDPVVYCLGPRPEVEEASCVADLERAGVEVHCLGARSNWQFPTVVSRLKRLLIRRKPDLVHTFLFHANIVGRIAARWAGIPHVVSGIRVAERDRRWHLWADRFTERLVDRHVCVSQSVARFSAEIGRLPVDKLTVIPNGIDVAAYPADPIGDLGSCGIAPGRRLITFVGRLTRQKGLSWLLETAPNWLDRLADCDLLIVGKGPQRRRLRTLSQELGIAHRVKMTGWRSDAARILAASDLLVLPSAWEGMPNVVLQAMASRLPVIATDVEGVRELLGDNADPQTAPYHDTEAFTKKLLAIMSDRQLASKLGEKNRQRAQEEFTLERVVVAYQDVWKSLLGN